MRSTPGSIARTGETLTEQREWTEVGDRIFARPATFGGECVAWVHFSGGPRSILFSASGIKRRMAQA